MNRRPGQIKVTTEVGFCPFCDRTRTLRREERQLGTLIRTVIECESCHRVLSSTIGVAGAEAPSAYAAADSGASAGAETKPTPVVAATPKPVSQPKSTASKTKPGAATPKASGAKPKAPSRPNQPAK